MEGNICGFGDPGGLGCLFLPPVIVGSLDVCPPLAWTTPTPHPRQLESADRGMCLALGGKEAVSTSVGRGDQSAAK